jgi:hypothetical protein
MNATSACGTQAETARETRALLDRRRRGRRSLDGSFVASSRVMSRPGSVARRSGLACAVALLASASAAAQTREITPMIGWQEGGVIEVEGARAPLDGSAVFGLMLSFDRGPSRRLDLVVTRQETTGHYRTAFGPQSIDVEIHTVQIGGRYLFEPHRRLSPYLGLTAGGTLFTFSGSDPALRFSAAGALGADYWITRSLAARFDARRTVTLTGSAAVLSCTSDGICTAFVEGTSFNQWNVSAGLVIAF